MTYINSLNGKTLPFINYDDIAFQTNFCAFN